MGAPEMLAEAEPRAPRTQAPLGEMHWIVVRAVGSDTDYPSRIRRGMYFRHPSEAQAVAEAEHRAATHRGIGYVVYAHVAGFLSPHPRPPSGRA